MKEKLQSYSLTVTNDHTPSYSATERLTINRNVDPRENLMKHTINLAKTWLSSGDRSPRAFYQLGLCGIGSVIIWMCLVFPAGTRADCRQGCDTNNDNTYLGNDALVSDPANGNTAIGADSLSSLTSGEANTAVGDHAMSLTGNASYNVAVGQYALQNATGSQNVAIGVNALELCTSGSNNTAVGFAAAGGIDAGYNNTAIGNGALTNIFEANDNTALGYRALGGSSPGSGNTAAGEYSLFNTESGVNNTAVGLSALQGDANGATGSYNTATGGYALSVNSSGSNNTADGIAALGSNTIGGSNTGIGQDALFSNNVGSTNTAVGSEALRNNTSGSNNIAIGVNAGMNITTGSSNIDIGNPGVAGDSLTIRIGGGRSTTKTFIWGIHGTTVANGVPVLISPSTSQLGTTTSSARYKENIQPMDKTSEAVLSLKPVTFRYKKELDPDSIPQFGLVAEQVEKVDPDLVVRDDDGKPYSVRYEAVNAMLLNEFLKEHQKVEKLQAALEAVNKRLGEQDTKIQRISEQSELHRAMSQIVSTNK
jgi:hypothetical protein